MRRFCLALPLMLALPVHAESISAEIGRSGLAAVETRLAALADMTDEERFTLGGVQFLRAVEISFQDRWREGLTDRTGFLPFLRLPLQDNPAPQPFQAGTIAGIFTKAEAELALARVNLTAIPEGSNFGAEIVVGDLWFDVTANSTRDPGEGLVEILNATLNPFNEAQAQTPLTVRFDVADAAWLAAYADLLSAFCHVILAYDPTEPITRILTARAEMAKLGPATPDLLLGGERVPDSVDMVAMVLATLNQAPDKALMAQAQTDLLQMIAENRQFWARVEAETDNRAEWLPNARQTSALGITVPPDAAVTWQAVLAEMEAVVKGDKLIPYWRVGPPAGINLAKIFTDPRPVDLAGWVQGWAALPYLQTGTLASAEAMDAFDQAAMGDSMLFAIYFN